MNPNFQYYAAGLPYPQRVPDPNQNFNSGYAPIASGPVPMGGWMPGQQYAMPQHMQQFVFFYFTRKANPSGYDLSNKYQSMIDNRVWFSENEFNEMLSSERFMKLGTKSQKETNQIFDKMAELETDESVNDYLEARKKRFPTRAKRLRNIQKNRERRTTGQLITSGFENERKMQEARYLTKNNPVCKFFVLNGFCRKGTKCPLRHDHNLWVQKKKLDVSATIEFSSKNLLDKLVRRQQAKEISVLLQIFRYLSDECYFRKAKDPPPAPKFSDQ